MGCLYREKTYLCSLQDRLPGSAPFVPVVDRADCRCVFDRSIFPGFHVSITVLECFGDFRHGMQTPASDEKKGIENSEIVVGGAVRQLLLRIVAVLPYPLFLVGCRHPLAPLFACR